MTSLLVLGAERSGVSMLAHALAHEEAMPLCEDIAQARARIAGGENLIACAPDATPDCPHLSSAAEFLAVRAELRAVVVWRQAVDFVNSRLRARPEQHFVDHCRLWARAQEMALRLRSKLPDRVELVEFRALVDRASPAAGKRALVSGFKLTSDSLAKFISASARGRTSLTPQRPVVDPARTGWSMGEVEAMARICGPAMLGVGDRVDLPAAERRRPLDIGRMFYERAHQVGHIEIAPCETAGASWTIAGEATAPSQLRLTAVAAGERRRLRLRARTTSVPARGVRWEVAESSTRRPLFVAPCLERGDIEVVLPAHDGLIEIALVCRGTERKQGLRMDLVDARLSHE
jgi:hypothetical protein